MAPLLNTIFRLTISILSVGLAAYIQLGCAYVKPDREVTGPPVGSIVPEIGYSWPAKERSYWPTHGWKSKRMTNHGIDPAKMQVADSLALADESFRSLLIVRDGFVVYEKYYYGGGPDESTEVWSVTKSFTSALIGIAIDKGHIEGVESLMADYLPYYPQLKDLTIRHVLTHTTGLNWDEGSQEAWIRSEDWIAEVLNSGTFDQPGRTLLYSSGNSHLLSALLQAGTGKTPGEYANDHLFVPLGIEFRKSNRDQLYKGWEELHIPVPGTWRQDNNGLEIGAFGLHLTAREMAKFGFLYLNKGKWNGQTLISEKWVVDSTRDHVLRSENTGFGYHWVVSKRVGQISFEADGWGGQMICVIPALDMIVVIKCDAVVPRGRNSYAVLEQAIRSGIH